MLEDLKKFFVSTTQFTYNQLAKWNMLIKNVQLKMSGVTQRYENTTVLAPTNGANFLDRLLRVADARWMSQRYDNFYIYNTQIPLLLEHYKIAALHPSMEGKMYKNLFSFSSISNINEYIILPEDNDWLRFLPISEENYANWNYVNPLTLWWTDSPEQTFDIVSMGNLRYYIYPPELSIWILDIPSLILKAVQYFRTLENGTIDIFLKDVFKVIPKMEMDLWIFKLQRHAVKIALGKESLSDVLSLYKKRESTYSYIGPNLEDALKEYINLFNEVKKGVIRPIQALSLIYRLQTLSRILEIQYNLSHFYQYKAMLLIRDIPYIDFVVDVYSLVPDFPMTRELILKLKNLLVKWKNDIPLTLIKNQSHREYIKKYLDRWQEFCYKQ